ncbi:CapA family protein [Oscillatoriales cyanobacterium LEGE 11467]|uniref:CapA family protein n=1 Tax=Zarconia navalis LEGE 11467 TaxID=1828826 RepID=A0A928W3G7_9CYAN|nr:CapA family protein [Zarconia navalis]MBE9042560.1 CapA family protein [Zarconia navalis LEGE 11467]
MCVAIVAIGCTERADSPDPTPTSLQTEPTPTLPQTTPEPWTVPEPEPTPTAAALPEPETSVVAVSIAAEPNRSNSEDALPPVPLDAAGATEFLDLRGVGDAAMAETHQQPYNLTDFLPRGELANFGAQLDRFDPTGKSYRGDLSFINWESTIGLRCNEFWAPLNPGAFAFVSHPDNMSEIYQRGFNLIGLANNHTRDCPSAEDGKDGALVSSLHMERLSREMGANWLWHGVGEQKEASVTTLNVKGRDLKVAFASLYLAEGDCTYVTCKFDEKTVLRSLRDADADLRILSIHSWTDETQQELVNLGVNFLTYYNGDVVFGHGPHVWAPVRVVESPTGKQGVLFESLGNFIHPALYPRATNIIGRVLFDIDTMKLRQVQIIPIALDRVTAYFGGAPDPSAVPANLNWQLTSDSVWQSGVNPQVRAAYSNIK